MKWYDKDIKDIKITELSEDDIYQLKKAYDNERLRIWAAAVKNATRPEEYSTTQWNPFIELETLKKIIEEK